MAGLAGADLPENITVIIEDEDDSVRQSSDGTVEIDTPDGGVVVRFPGAYKDPEGAASADDPEKFYQNLANKIDGLKLGVICEDLIQAVEADDASRQQWLTNRQKGMDLLGLQLKEPSSGSAGDSSNVLEGLSTVTNPLLLNDCIKGWANAQAELLPAAGPCKVEDVGTEGNEETTQLADAYERGMNAYLTDVAKEYYPATSKMLLWGTIFSGSGFKKVYRCPLRRRPVSDQVDPQNLIVSDTSDDLAACERITHRIPMRRSVLKRMQKAGAYLSDVELTQPTPTATVVDEKIAAIQGTRALPERPEDQPYTIYEIQCELDLEEFAPAAFKGTGIALPYLVTIEKDSRVVLALRRDWRPEDKECERKRQYVRYPYIPGPGFYGTGLLNILGNASAAMTAAWREMLDAGMMANFPGFLVAKSATRQNTSDLRVGIAQGTQIDTGGKPINDVVAKLPYNDVTGGLMQLVDKITAQSKEAGAAAEVPVGEGTQNIPVGTMLAMIEAATKVMAASHKGMHTAQSDELQMLADLFREDPEAFWRTNKKVNRDQWSEQKLLKALTNCNLVPKSDPNVPSHIHRIMKAVALCQVIMMPPFAAQTNPKEAYLRVLRAMREDPDGLVIQPPPQDNKPNPDEIKANAAMMSAQAKMQELPIKAQKIAADRQNQQDKARIEQQKGQAQQAVKTVELAKELVEQDGDNQRAERQHGMDMTKLALETGKHAAEMRERAEGGAVERFKTGLAAVQHVNEHGLASRQQEFAERQHADQHALEMVQHLNEMASRAKEHTDSHGLDVRKHEDEHGLAVKAQQDQHALGVFEATKPDPKPAGGTKKKK